LMFADLIRMCKCFSFYLFSSLVICMELNNFAQCRPALAVYVYDHTVNLAVMRPKPLGHFIWRWLEKMLYFFP